MDDAEDEEDNAEGSESVECTCRDTSPSSFPRAGLRCLEVELYPAENSMVFIPILQRIRCGERRTKEVKQRIEISLVATVAHGSTHSMSIYLSLFEFD